MGERLERFSNNNIRDRIKKTKNDRNLLRSTITWLC